MADRFDVVIVNDRAEPVGGASKVAVQSAVGLSRRGHRVRFLAALAPVAPELVAAGVEVRTLDQSDLARGSRLQMAVQGLWNRRAADELRRSLAAGERGRTVVHIHSWSKSLSASVFAAAGRSGFPVAATLHDYGFVCPNAALHDFPDGRFCERSPMSASCVSRNCDSRHVAHKWWRVGRQLALERLAKAADRLDLAVCVSGYSHDILRPLLPPRLVSRVLPNPIDVEDRGPSRPADARRFLYVGRLSQEKGVLLAAEAAKRADVPLDIVGEGELRDEVARLNPAAAITGWLSPPDVHAAIRASRAVIVPSVWRETQGMVVPEAFACGVPVIASSGTAPAGALTPGVTGLVFSNGDADALAEVLRRLAGDDALVESMGRVAYDRYWHSPPTMDRHLDGLEAVYAGLLASRSN